MQWGDKSQCMSKEHISSLVNKFDFLNITNKNLELSERSKCTHAHKIYFDPQAVTKNMEGNFQKSLTGPRNIAQATSMAINKEVRSHE